MRNNEVYKDGKTWDNNMLPGDPQGSQDESYFKVNNRFKEGIIFNNVLLCGSKDFEDAFLNKSKEERK